MVCTGIPGAMVKREQKATARRGGLLPRPTLLLPVPRFRGPTRALDLLCFNAFRVNYLPTYVPYRTVLGPSRVPPNRPVCPFGPPLPHCMVLESTTRVVHCSSPLFESTVRALPPQPLSPIQSHRCALGMRQAVTEHQGPHASGQPLPGLALPAAEALSRIYLLILPR